MCFDKLGYSIKADYTSVSALAINESSNEDVLMKRIDNLTKISSLRTGETIDKDVDKEIKKIIEYYGTK
jgi:hypothetical protein